jgi:hypothetical protein
MHLMKQFDFMLSIIQKKDMNKRMQRQEFEVTDKVSETADSNEEIKSIMITRGGTSISFQIHITETRMKAIAKFMERIGLSGRGRVIQGTKANSYSGQEHVALRLQDGYDEPRLEYRWISWGEGGLYLRMKNADVKFDQKAENDILTWLNTQYY